MKPMPGAVALGHREQHALERRREMKIPVPRYRCRPLGRLQPDVQDLDAIRNVAGATSAFSCPLMVIVSIGL